MGWTIAKLENSLERMPRVELCGFPSPIVDCNSLSEKWNLGFHLEMKRDDILGPGLGGNKSRQLEYLLGAAIAEGCDSVVHGGAIQSNYCRQLAAACAMNHLDCYLYLSNYYDQKMDTGSHLIDSIMGAEIRYFNGPLGVIHEQAKAQWTKELRQSGDKPYLITYPKSEILGGLGYVRATTEFVKQYIGREFPKRIVIPAVGASYAGLLLGLEILGHADIEIIGVAPLNGEYNVEEAIANSMKEMAGLLGFSFPNRILDRININFDCVGRGYAMTADENLAVLVDVARTEGILLDPVYTSKAMYFLRSLPSDGNSTLFWHTGGTAALFSYSQEILQFLQNH